MTAADHDRPPVTGTPARKRAGGRSERIRRQVAEAVLELVQGGNPAPTVPEVAKRVGVYPTTVYRWWPTTAHLLREALNVHTARIRLPDTGTWEGDVLHLFRELADFFSDPVEMAMNSLMARGTDAQFDAVSVEHWLPIAEDLAHVVERAKGRGEVSADTDPRVVLSLVISPILMHTVFLHAPLPEADLHGLAKAVSRSFAVGPQGGAQPT